MTLKPGIKEDVFNASDWIRENLRLDRIRQDALDSLRDQGQDSWETNLKYEQMSRADVCTGIWTSAHHGRYMATVFLESIGIEHDDEDEWIYDLMDSIADKIASAIAEYFPDMEGYWYFSTLEGSGDYGLFYALDIPVPEDWKEMDADEIQKWEDLGFHFFTE